MTLPVSVVIPSYNRPEQLSPILKRVIENRPKEVILVDDCSINKEKYELLVKNTKKYAEAFDVDIKLIRNKINKGASESRKIGFSAISEGHVLFIDDDILLTESYIHCLYETAVQHEQCASVSGKILLVETIEEFEKFEGKVKRGKVTTVQKELKTLSIVDEKTLRISPNKILDASPGIYSVDYTWNPLLWSVKFLKEQNIEFFPYVGNGYREESDPQVQANRKGGLTLLNTNVVCFHLGTKNEGGQWGSGAFRNLRWYISSLDNNWIFLTRHHNFLKSKGNKYSKIRLQINLALRLLSVFVPKKIIEKIRK